MTHEQKVSEVARKFKQAVESKYDIIELKLFGSSARQDYSKTSDIDIMVRLPRLDREIEEDLFDTAYELELEYDCVIDVIVLPQDFSESIPLYQNILKEGVEI